MDDSELEPLDRAAGRDEVVGMEDGVTEDWEEVAFGNVVDRDGPAGLFGSTIPGFMPPPPGAVGKDRFVGFGEGILMTDVSRKGEPVGGVAFSGGLAASAASAAGECGGAGKAASSLRLRARVPNTEGGNAGSGRFPLSLSSPLEIILDLEAFGEVVIGVLDDGADGGQRFTIFGTVDSFGLAPIPSNELRGNAELVVAGA